MKLNYLFPNRYKKVGWTILIPSLLVGILALIFNIEPAFLDVEVPAVFIDEFFGETKLIGFVKNNILNEIVGILIIISAFLVAFSKEKQEDEFISKEAVEQFKSEMDTAEADYDFFSYQGAFHGFSNPAADERGRKFNIPLAYNESADRNSWKAMQNLFENNF